MSGSFRRGERSGRAGASLSIADVLDLTVNEACAVLR